MTIARVFCLSLLWSLLLLQPAHATKRTVVLVADLAASKVSAEDATTISDLLRGELARERKFILVQRGEMETIAEELELQMSGCTDQSCAVQLGQMLNAEKVIVGRVAKLFGRLTITAQVVDMAANDIEFAEEVDCSEEYASVKKAIGELAAKLSRHVPVLAEVKGKNSDVFVLDAGSREGVAVGQRLAVLRTAVVKGEDGKPLMEKKQQVGELEITYANARDSEAKWVSGEIGVGDYVRMVAAAAAGPASPPAATAPAATPAPRPPEARSSNTAAGGTFTDPVTGMEFVWVPAGSFQMGDEFGDGESDELPVHTVTISQGFYLGKYEVTQAEWQLVTGTNPSRFPACGSNCPVEYVTWKEVQKFITALNTQTGLTYRLPTEAEWEYAAKGGPGGGDGTKYAGSGVVGEVAWYRVNSGSVTHPVGQKVPNGLGLYDMSGNVWEWVQDWYGSYSTQPVTDPQGPATGTLRVNRCGGENSLTSVMRVARRIGNSPDARNYDIGFRLLRAL